MNSNTEICCSCHRCQRCRKDTSIGKLADQLKAEGKKVVLAAADTFRAAAIDQLAEWANRAGVELIARKRDPILLP